jgi:hypothetical protein
MAYAVSTVASTLFVSTLAGLTPGFMARLDELAGVIVEKLELQHVTEREVQVWLVTFLLCFLWGVGFKRLGTREDR